MRPPLRFAEAVCAGHPDRLADTIADRIVDLAVRRDPDALVGVEVALHRNVVFIDGRIASGDGAQCAVSEEEVRGIPCAVFGEAGYGQEWVGFQPSPEGLRVELDLCLGPLESDERSFRQVSDDQVIAVGYACQGERAGLIPLEQALARDFAKAMEDLRRTTMRELLGPDGKVLIAVRGRRLEAVSLSLRDRRPDRRRDDPRQGPEKARRPGELPGPPPGRLAGQGRGPGGDRVGSVPAGGRGAGVGRGA